MLSGVVQWIQLNAVIMGRDYYFTSGRLSPVPALEFTNNKKILLFKNYSTLILSIW